MSNKIGVSTWVWTSPFSNESLALFDTIKSLGFDSVEIPVEDLSLLDGKRVKKALDDSGLFVTVCGAFGPGRDLSSDSREVVQSTLSYIRGCLDLCNEVGATFFAGPMYAEVGKARQLPPEERLQEWQRSVENLRTVSQEAESRSLQIAVEAINRFELPRQTTQAIVGVASGWNSSHVTLHRYEKDSQGAWKLVAKPWKGRLGSSGLAWGRGLSPVPSGVTMKKEGDRRAPAGVFSLGGAWGYDAKTTHHPNLSFTKITTRDLWVEDTASKYYNQHVRLDHEPAASWEKKAQMRQNDHAHSLKLFINHNAPKPLAGAGSSIFFHIWRGGGSKATFGCTTMHENELKTLIQWLNPSRTPVYILLTQDEYNAKRLEWKLP